ncbi:hypothetical protein [Azotosporobacter soli]|uniref:hypothetical protein n=1 Tax=Azotosporobacter soli TaxID=3055040 RepID=UPI0031FE5926
MELTTKDKVLIAIYTEYQKDVPNMREFICANKLEMDKQVFISALVKLENERLISNIKVLPGDSTIMDIYTGMAKITVAGIEYTEKLLEINSDLDKESKLKKVMKWLLDQGQDLTARAIVEGIKMATGI